MAQSMPEGAVLPPAPPAYITPEDLEAMVQHHSQEQDGLSWGTVDDLKRQAQQSDINDITPFLGLVRAIVFFHGGRRRIGDVAHFCEMRVAKCAVEGFRIAACVVDIVHGPKHDISIRGRIFLCSSNIGKSSCNRCSTAMRNFGDFKVGGPWLALEEKSRAPEIGLCPLA